MRIHVDSITTVDGKEVEPYVSIQNESGRFHVVLEVDAYILYEEIEGVSISSNKIDGELFDVLIRLPTPILVMGYEEDPITVEYRLSMEDQLLAKTQITYPTPGESAVDFQRLLLAEANTFRAKVIDTTAAIIDEPL